MKTIIMVVAVIFAVTTVSCSKEKECFQCNAYFYGTTVFDSAHIDKENSFRICDALPDDHPDVYDQDGNLEPVICRGVK